MDAQAQQQTAVTKPRPALSYEAPCIEMVLTAEDLEREVLHAGLLNEY